MVQLVELNSIRFFKFGKHQLVYWNEEENHSSITLNIHRYFANRWILSLLNRCLERKQLNILPRSPLFNIS